MLKDSAMQTWHATTAIKELAEAITADTEDRLKLHLRKAEAAISSLREEVSPPMTLEEEAAEWSMALHTFMRKCDDSLVGTALYKAIDEGRGINAWYRFVLWSRSSRGYQSAIWKAKEGMETTDELIMVALIEAWALRSYTEALMWIEEK